MKKEMTDFYKLLMQHAFEVVVLAMEHPFQQSFPLSLVLSPVQWKLSVTHTHLGMWNCIGQNERRIRLTSAEYSELKLSWCTLTFVMATSQEKGNISLRMSHQACDRTGKDTRGRPKTSVTSLRIAIFGCLGPVSFPISVSEHAWLCRKITFFEPLAFKEPWLRAFPPITDRE